MLFCLQEIGIIITNSDDTVVTSCVITDWPLHHVNKFEHHAFHWLVFK